MSISILKADNLIKLLDGLSLLDNRDQEQIIKIVDVLDFAKKKTEKSMKHLHDRASKEVV
jgi:hypothetical protein